MIIVLPYFLKDLEQSESIYCCVRVHLEEGETPETQLLRFCT